MRHDADGAGAVRLAGVLLGELVRGVVGELETATAAGVAACDLLNKRAGHGSITTTQRYLHPDDSSITGAGVLLSKHLSVTRAGNSAPYKVPTERV